MEFLNSAETSGCSHVCRVTTTMTHSSRDLLVRSNGTVQHNVIINAELDCEIKMFNYPFATDQCPIAIQAWAFDGEFCYCYLRG